MGLLRDIFGPSRADIWQQVAQESNGHFGDGGFLGEQCGFHARAMVDHARHLREQQLHVHSHACSLREPRWVPVRHLL